MSVFSKIMVCPVCETSGTAVYMTVGVNESASRLQSFDCEGGCWAPGGPGAVVIEQLNAAPVVER